MSTAFASSFIPVGFFVREILASASAIHDELGPGLDACVYRIALEHDLAEHGLIGEPLAGSKLLCVGRRVGIEVRGAGQARDEPVEHLRAIVHSAALELIVRIDFDVAALIAGVRRIYAHDDAARGAA